MCRKVMYLVSVVVPALSLVCAAQGIEPAADAYIRAGDYTDTNYGGNGSLVLKNASNQYNRKVYFRFEVSAPVSDASIEFTVATNNEGGGGSTPQTFTVEVYGLAESLDDTWTEEDEATYITGVFLESAEGIDVSFSTVEEPDEAEDETFRR